MAKYIDAEKVIAALTDTLQYEGMVMDELISVVANIPAADVVERKTGKWIHTDTQVGYDINGDLVWADMMKCETCGFKICTIKEQYNFCPNCGADMRGEGHE